MENSLKPITAEEASGILRVGMDNTPTFVAQLLQGILFIRPFAHGIRWISKRTCQEMPQAFVFFQPCISMKGFFAITIKRSCIRGGVFLNLFHRAECISAHAELLRNSYASQAEINTADCGNSGKAFISITYR